jgi:hypothetical protein
VTSPNGIRAVARIGGSDVVTKRDLGREREKGGTENNFLRFKVSLLGFCRNLFKRSNSSCQPAKVGAACRCRRKADGKVQARIIL